MQQFKSATDTVHATLHTKGLDTEKYLSAVRRLQQLADMVSQNTKLIGRKDLDCDRGFER